MSLDGPIAYLVKRFPRLSETFVLNEFLEVRRAGIDARLYALADPGESVAHPEALRLLPEVRYLNDDRGAWRSRWRLWRGALAQAAAHPLGFARVVIALLTVHRSVPSARHAVEALWLARELRQAGVRHLHAHFAHSPAAVAYLCRLAGGPPFSFTAHAKDLYTTLPRNLRIRARAATVVLTCTEENGRFLRELLGPELAPRVEVIHHGTDLARFSADGRRPEPGLILSVGRLVPKKGFVTLLESIGLLSDAGRSVRLEVFGGGPMRQELEAYAERLHIGDRVRFHGARPTDEIVAAYRQASLFVLAPAIQEDGDRDGIPNVLVEAMAAGVPVISTRISGIPELIADGIDGLLVPPGDAPSLATAIGRMLDDDALASGLAAEARRTVGERFDLARSSRRVASLLSGAPEPAMPGFGQG